MGINDYFCSCVITANRPRRRRIWTTRRSKPSLHVLRGHGSGNQHILQTLRFGYFILFLSLFRICLRLFRKFRVFWKNWSAKQTTNDWPSTWTSKISVKILRSIGVISIKLDSKNQMTQHLYAKANRRRVDGQKNSHRKLSKDLKHGWRKPTQKLHWDSPISEQKATQAADSSRYFNYRSLWRTNVILFWLPEKFDS